MVSKNYNNLLNEIETISDENNLKDYHAFIYWFLETFGYKKQEILDSICDGTHDKGIDAVIINDIEKKVIIIQSKFERAGERVQIKDSDIKLLSTVRDYFKSRKALTAAISKGNNIAIRLMNEAFEVIRNSHYSLELVFITTHRNAPQIEELVHETLGFKPGEFSVWHYSQIMQLFSDRLRGFTPPIGPYCLPYKDADKAIIKTAKYRSWVITVPLDEIRSMVNKFEDKLFRKNVREFLGTNRCNRGIQETLKSNPDNFWYYNNGICILCDEANLVVEKNYIRLVNPQIINGCQTVRSVQKFQGDLVGDVLVRVIESKDHEFVNAITLYQNTSNPVKKRDLKSNDPIQVRLENEFKLQHWYYEIKRGKEFSKMKKKYPSMKQYFKSSLIPGYKVINNEEVAKALAAINLGPSIAIAKGSENFFDEYYDKLFTPQISTFNCLGPMIIFWLIKKTYYASKRFHNFRKAFVFKNPATFYVLKFIYESLNKQKDWEKRLVLFYENSDNETYNKFFNDTKKVISKYFEIIYKSWKKSKQPDHRSYLQNSKTFNEIKSKHNKEIKKLSKQISRKIIRYLYLGRKAA